MADPANLNQRARVRLTVHGGESLHYEIVSVARQAPPEGRPPNPDWTPGPAVYFGLAYGSMGECRRPYRCPREAHDCPLDCVRKGPLFDATRDAAEAMAAGINAAVEARARKEARAAKQTETRRRYMEEHGDEVRARNLNAVKRYRAKSNGKADG